MVTNYDNICSELLGNDWRALFATCSGANPMYDTFAYLCHTSISLNVSLKIVKNGGSKSTAVKRALKEKNRCHRIHKQLNSEISLEAFKAASASVNRAVLAESERYFLFEPDVRKFYSYVNNKLKGGHSHTTA